MEIRVECYAGHRGEETPRALLFDGRRVEVTELLDQWLAPDHRYFKVKASDGALYIIRHDPRAGRCWPPWRRAGLRRRARLGSGVSAPRSPPGTGWRRR